MEFRGRKPHSGIETLSDWKIHGKPASTSHWKDGRSAKELARHWLSGQAEREVVELLEPQYPDIELIVGVAEEQTAFDTYRGGKRNHDLLVTAKYAKGALAIGVEGKADEPFGDPLWKQLESATEAHQENERSRALDRLTDLAHLFLGPAVDLSHGSVGGELGYQLLTALAGTLAAAKSMNAVSAVFLAHEFDTQETERSKRAANAKQYETFISLMGAQKPETASADAAWICPAVPVAGDGGKMPTSLDVSFAKLVTKVPPRPRISDSHKSKGV